MKLSKNPSNETIRELIEASPCKAAKWIKEIPTGDRYYWPADQALHARVADILHIEEYEKGLAVSI